MQTSHDVYTRISEILEGKSNELTAVSDRIWDFAETRYEEIQSAEILAATLEEEGFEVQRNAGDIETAFVASFGSGKPVIAFLGEYDALSGLSQQADSATKDPIEEGGNGHGCGHNLLGTGAMAAAIAVKQLMEETGLEGTVRYYGCPAEEGGGGKAFMARAGLFDDVDVALTWHPWDENQVYHARMLATCQVYFRFTGTSSHAAFSPHLGRSALDAVELMNIGSNFLREHIIPEGQLHYAITDTGGMSPNVVQANAEVLYKIRAPKMGQVEEILERVKDVARGAALMTGTQLEIQFDAASADLIPNETLGRLIHKHLITTKAPSYTEEETAFAQSIQQTFSAEEKAVIEKNDNKVLAKGVKEFSSVPGFFKGSTDVGDVSWLVPTGQIYITTCAFATPFHSWQLVTQGKSSVAHKGMLYTGKVLAAAAMELLEQPELLEGIKAEHQSNLEGETYRSLIPSDTKPAPIKRVAK
ncbi:amidohydrolase [Terribacillus saccharophilus]|uniref:amidohydrolase n=1 Tax=Terribacillus saccharophilus TaxID=361277 RepID=UPI002989FB9B|nr:amidohydrolase [Terribacillus saccharophilus]MCM3225994.1 amidohydrolase [Terribacillus saccharophilus]